MMHYCRAVVLAGFFLWLSGCSGIPAHRAGQYSAISSGWDPATRTRLLDQRIQVGDTREMVYIALGPPLTQPTLTTDQPPLEHWEFLAFKTEPIFPAGNQPGAPLVSSAAQPEIQAQTTNNVVMPDLTGPSAKLLVMEFGPDNKVVDWKLYGNAQGRVLNPGFAPIQMPKSPR